MTPPAPESAFDQSRMARHVARSVAVGLGLAMGLLGDGTPAELATMWVPLVAVVAGGALWDRAAADAPVWALDLAVVLGVRLLVDPGVVGEPLLPLLVFPVIAGHHARAVGVVATVVGVALSYGITPAVDATTSADVAVAVFILGALALAGAVVGEISDRQARVRATTVNRVRRLEAVLSAVVRHDPRGVIVRDERGDIVELNPAAADMLGVDTTTFETLTRGETLLQGPLVDEDGIELTGRSPSELARATGDIVAEQVIGIGDGDGRRWLAVAAIPVDTADGRWVVSLIRDATSETRARSRLEREVAVDPLTGLGNRRQLEWVFEALDGSDETVAVLVLDLDDLKPINDRHGHPVGDDVLREVGTRLEASTRPGDTVVRLGGDEYVALLRDVGDRDAEQVIDRIRAALDAPVPTAAGLLHVSASIGHSSGAGTDARNLLRQADADMYAHKRAHHARLLDPR